MPVYKGNTEIDKVYLGSTEIAQIYKGTQEIWSNVKVVSLGSGTSFNIKNLYPTLYDKLTADNFFFRTADTASGTNGIRMNANATSREYAGFAVGIAKSYDSSTGVLSFYNYVSPGNSRNVSAVMVPKLTKLIRLGNGRSFNVSTYEGYQNFTADNFLIQSADRLAFSNSYYPQGYTYDDSGSCTSTVPKSYDASTGVLSTGINLRSNDTSGTYTYFNNSQNGNVIVYLALKI